MLLEAAALVLRRCPDAEFVIAGDGPRRQELEALAQAQGIASRVQFIGHADDVPALLASSDLFVLPSRSEAFPNSVLEAMATGLPIVATRVGGIVELVENQRTGVLVPPDDARALGHAMLDLIQWRSHAVRLGRAARARGRGALLVGAHDFGLRASLHRAAWRARARPRSPTELMAS